MTSRVGISKVLIPSSSFAMGVIPLIAPYILTSSTVATSDWTSSRLYCEYTASNGSNQVSMATYVSPQVGSPFYLNQPLSLSLVGVNQNMIVDMDLSTAAEVKVWFTEVGNTAAPGTINASLLLTHDRAMFINQQLPALTPITTQGDLIVGDAGGNAIRLGVGTTSQVLTVAGSTAVWADAGGGGMTNPMTTLGDMIIGGASGVPAQLVHGTNGYILRYTNATGPAWRELSGAGLLSARSAGVAIREGQTYWATDGAVGSELTLCVHQGGGVYAWITIPHDTTGGIAQPAYDFTSPTGLTPFLGTAGNTVTVGGGVAAIYSPAAGGQLRFDSLGFGFLAGPALYRNFDTPVAQFDVATRVLAPGGYGDGNCRYGIEVATLGSGANPALPRQRFTFSADSGNLNWENEAGYQSALAGAVPLDGTGWLRIQMIGTTMTFWLGISTGNVVPTTWTMKKRFIPTSALYESVCVSLQIGGSMPSPTTANFGALAILLPPTL